VDLGPRPEIVRQDDAVEAAGAAIGHAAVLGELGSPPQDHGHGPGLEEDGLLHLLAVPAQAFVERPGPADVGDAERNNADALLHASNLADATDINAARGSPDVGVVVPVQLEDLGVVLRGVVLGEVVLGDHAADYAAQVAHAGHAGQHDGGRRGQD